jgi:transglutaminase-like putative cysteine protease
MALLQRSLRSLFRIDRLLLIVLAVVAVAPFARLFASASFFAYAAGAAVLEAVVVALLEKRAPLAVSLLVEVAVLALYVVFVVFHLWPPVLSDLPDVWTGVSGSWHEMLTTSLPAVSSPTLLTLPTMLAGFAAIAGLELAARTRFIVLVVLPSLAAFVVGLLLTGARPLGSPLAPLVLLAGAIGVVLVRANTGASAVGDGSAAVQATIVGGEQRSRVPSFVALGAAVLVVALVVSVLVGERLPVVDDAARVDLRDRFQPPVDDLAGVTPLALVPSGLTSAANPVVFTASFGVQPDGPSISRIRVAELDRYDGTVWGASAHLTTVGQELPSGPTVFATTATVTQSIALTADYRSAFLPALDRPTSVDGDGLLFDRQSGMVVAADPNGRLRYDVTSAVPNIDALVAKPPADGTDPDYADDALLPPGVAVPPAITDYADQPQFVQPNAYASLKAIEKDMHANFGYATNGTPGHSYQALASFLAPKGSAGSTGRVGDAEQYAAAFAVIARTKHLPSRVVVGYKLDPKAVATGKQVDVHARDVDAWPEVYFRNVGWVPFFPTNSDNPAQAQPPPPPSTPTQASNPTPNVAHAAPAPSRASCTGSQCPDDSTEVLVLWPLLLLLLLVLVPVAIVLAKWVRRRRRRRRGSVTQRVMGAWRESMDRFTVYGVPTSPALTPNELAAKSEPIAGDLPAARVAAFSPVLDAVLYREDEPGDHLVEQAWDGEAGITDALQEDAGWLMRFRAAIDPRPLLPRRR